MSALLQPSIFRTKIHAKLHVFLNIDFEDILGGFGEGFGRPKSSIFALFLLLNFFGGQRWSQETDFGFKNGGPAFGMLILR